MLTVKNQIAQKKAQIDKLKSEIYSLKVHPKGKPTKFILDYYTGSTQHAGFVEDEFCGFECKALDITVLMEGTEDDFYWSEFKKAFNQIEQSDIKYFHVVDHTDVWDHDGNHNHEINDNRRVMSKKVLLSFLCEEYSGPTSL